MEVNGAPGGGGHARRSKRPALPPPPTQLEGEGWGLEPASRGCSGLGMIVPCVSGSLDLLCGERF